MAYDKNNFCWISYPNGIQKFDGQNFISVPIQPGLPDDKFAYFLRCANGDLFISHIKGVSKYEIGSNRFVQVYAHVSEKKPAQFIGEDHGIIYFYTASGNITGIDRRTFKVTDSSKTSFAETATDNDYRPAISSNVIDHKVAFEVRGELFLWDLQKGQLVSHSGPIPEISPYLLRLKTGSQVIFFTYKINNALQLYDFATSTTSILPVKGKDNKSISRCVIFPWRNRILISFSDHLYETDSTLQVLGTEIMNYQNQPIAGVSGIPRIREDNFGNLCISTITAGIKKVIRNNYPVKYYGTEKREGNNILSILPDKNNNRILAGTSGNGLLIFDTLQHLIKHIKTLPGTDRPFSPVSIIKDNKGSYWLLCNSEENVWKLANDLSRMDPIPISFASPGEKRANYFGNFLFQDEKGSIIQSQNRLYRISFASNTISGEEFSRSYVMTGLYNNGTIISHANDELIFIDASMFKELKKIPFKNTGNVRCFARDVTGSIYVGSNKGIFKIDNEGRILSHLTKESGLPDECIYAMVLDESGALWCSSNKGIFKVKADNSILQLKKEDGLQENEFNTNVAARTDDGEVFFGGMNGVSSFYPAAINSVEEKISLLVTRIRVNNEEAFKDTAAWNIQKINLPYDQNSLSFDFIAMANNNPGQYIYQYKMEGIDKQWIQNTDLQTVRYFLPPADYVLKLYAGRSFDKDAVPMKEIRITINPPFWKTWWFITAMILLLISGLAYGINSYNKKKYRKKLMELESEHKLQMERERISRDLHDSIGAYANAVLYNTELLEKESALDERSALMSDLKFASKDIITSLRETIWALKKDSYSAEECLLRIKNFVQPLSRYYSHIQFNVTGDAPTTMKGGKMGTGCC